MQGVLQREWICAWNCLSVCSEIIHVEAPHAAGGGPLLPVGFALNGPGLYEERAGIL